MPVDPDSLDRSLGALQLLLAAGKAAPHTHDPAATIERIVLETHTMFELSAGLMLRDEQAVMRYVAASDDSSDALERVQEQLSAGPCVDCALTDRIVDSADIQGDERWPEVGNQLRGDIRAVLAVPVRLSGAPVGSLNVHSEKRRSWDDPERRAMLSYASIVEQALLDALASRHQSALVDQLQYALEHRVTIERAVGYLMSMLRLDNAAAFNALRRTARSQRRPIAEVATQVLASGRL